MAVGGDILEITFNHPDVGSGTIFPKAAEDNTFNLGGFRIDDDANGITGNGEMIAKMSRERWSFGATVAWDMNIREDLQKIAELAASPKPATYTIQHVNGTIYKGDGWPVGSYEGNGNSATFPLKLAGGGLMKKQ